MIHSDVCGKINSESKGGNQYFLTLIDDATHYTWVYVLKTKDQVFNYFKEWKTLVENQFSCKVKTLKAGVHLRAESEINVERIFKDRVHLRELYDSRESLTYKSQRKLSGACPFESGE